MPLTTAASIYFDFITGDPELKTYWMDQIDWVDGHPDDFPDQSLVEVVAEMLGDALAEDITGLTSIGFDENSQAVPALFIRILEEAAGHIDYTALAEQLIAHAAAGLPAG
jgi:hypothetical protein